MADDAPQEPVTLEQIKQHLDVVRVDQDDMLTGMGVAAREWVESYTGLVLTARQVAQGFDSFGTRMTLHAWPIREATGIVTYLDESGAEQIIPTAPLARMTRPARLPAAAGVQQVVPIGDPIVVTVKAGYAAPDEVPYQLKAAILLTVGNLTGLRVSEQDAIDNLCRPFRLPVIG